MSDTIVSELVDEVTSQISWCSLSRLTQVAYTLVQRL